jgi:hypothetical protein
MPILLNVLIGVPQMLSNIQMILICVAVSGGTHRLFACRDERRLTTLLFLTDRCPSRAEHVPRAARERLALSPPAKRAKGAPGQRPLTASGIWFPRCPRVAQCHVHVSLPSLSHPLCPLQIFKCAKVVLVLATQWRAVFLASSQVRKLPRRAHE